MHRAQVQQGARRGSQVRRLLAALIIGALAAPATAQDHDRGEAAYKRGDERKPAISLSMGDWLDGVSSFPGGCRPRRDLVALV